MILGIDNLKKIVAQIGAAGSIGYDILEDGKVSIRDLGELKDIFKMMKELGSVDYSKLKPEIADIDEAEQEALCAVFKESLKVGGGSTEETIEMGFDMLIKLLDALSAFVDWGAKK